MNTGVIIALVGGLFFFIVIIAIVGFVLFGSSFGKSSKPQSSTSSGSDIEPDIGGVVFPIGNAAPSGSNTSKGVILWKDPSYTGSSSAFGPGDHSLVNDDLRNDASSIQISPGCSVTVWDKVDYSGSSATYNVSSETLKGTGLNDDIASLRVACNY